MKRRQVFPLALLIPFAACNSNPSNPGGDGTGGLPPYPSAQVGQVANDVDLIASALLGVLPTIEQVAGERNASAMQTVNDAIVRLQALAAELKSVSDANAARPQVEQVQSAVQAVLSAVGMLGPVPLAVTTVLQAANALLPVILQAVNLPPRQASGRYASAMTSEQARSTLRAHAPGRR